MSERRKLTKKQFLEKHKNEKNNVVKQKVSTMAILSAILVLVEEALKRSM